jgi:hypothetical protein
MNPFHKSLIAAAAIASTLSAFALEAPTGPIGGPAGPIVINIPNGSPNDGMACRSTPNAYSGSQSGNTFFCKRNKTVNAVLQCLEPGFPTKVIREGPGGGGKDLCAAPGRVYTSNSPLTGTQGIDYKFFAVDSAKVATVVANQRRDEATALGVAEAEVDAKSLNSAIALNQIGSEDKLQITLEFATFPRPVGGVLLGAR